MPKRHRICVIGAGRWGSNHVRTLDELGLLGGLVDTDSSCLTAFSKQYPGLKTFSRAADAVDEGFDGFIVATPAETHLEIGKFLIEKEIPTLIEKPITLSSADARELSKLAEEKQVCLMVGHVLLFHPAIRKIKNLLDNGKIGRLQYIYSNRLNLGTVRTEENILWSFAPHDLSIFEYLIGRTPLEVVSRGAAYLQSGIHDTTMTTLRYSENIVGHIFVSWLHPFKEHRIVVIGSKGMLSFEDSSPKKELLFYEKGIDWIKGEPVPRNGATETIPYDPGAPLKEELLYFVDNLQNPRPEIANADSGVRVLEVLERATKSLTTDTAVSVPSEATDAGDKAGFIHPSSYVDVEVSIGPGTKVWHFCHIQSHVKIGSNCSLGQNVNIGPNVRIGNGVKIQNNVSVYEGVELEDYVFCGPSMVFTNVNMPRAKYPQESSKCYSRTLVKEGATLGANSTIVCGNTIGRHAMVAAGAVVTADVPDYALVHGIPARRTGWVSERGVKLEEFDNNGRTRCPLGGEQYELVDGRLARVRA